MENVTGKKKNADDFTYIRDIAKKIKKLGKSPQKLLEQTSAFCD